MQIDKLESFILVSPEEFMSYKKQESRITALSATNKFLSRELDCKTAEIKELRETIAAQHQDSIEVMRFAKRIVAMAESAPECVLDRRLPL